MDGIGTEVRGDGVAEHIQLHRALEEDRPQTVVVVVQRTLNGGEDGLREVGGVVLGAEIAHVKAQGLVDKFTAVFTIIRGQPAVHTGDQLGIQPYHCALDPLFVIFLHFCSTPF